MSKTTIPPKVKIMLAGRAAGRCQFRGCPELLDEDQLTRRSDNFGAFAHIVADSAGGPRGDLARSEELAKDIKNLMLLCLKHHKLIDGENWREFPEEMLLQMKSEQEERIRQLTSYQGESRTHLLLLDAGIGSRAPLVTKEIAGEAALPRWAQGETRVRLSNLRLEDGEELFWRTGLVEVGRAVEEVEGKIERHEIGHVSVFALAPIPLLMWLGYRLGDTFPGEAFQRRRDIEGWNWSDSERDLGFSLQGDLEQVEGEEAVLMISVSGTAALPQELENAPRLVLCVDSPGLDVVKARAQVESFKHHVRLAMSVLSGFSTIHVVAAIPNSLAVEFGRVQLPKVAPALVIWDRHTGKGGTLPTIVMHGGQASLAGR